MNQLMTLCQQDKTLSPLIKKAQQNLALDFAFKKILPGAFSKQCQVIQLDKAGTLTIFARSNIMAAKLKLLAPQWPIEFKKQGFCVLSITIHVLPNSVTESKKAARKTHVTPSSLQGLLKTASRQSNPKLSASLKELIATLKINTNISN